MRIERCGSPLRALRAPRALRAKQLARVAAVVGLIGPFAAWPAEAQTEDYGSFQKLFGEPITTSATGSPQRESDVPVTMEIISQDEIRRSGLPTIPDILGRYTSISVWRNSPLQADVAIRGYNRNLSNRLLVLVNGRQVFTTVFNFTAWPSIPVQLDEIRQIEVVRGPNTALFGFNAVGGVVNIVTYNPLYDDRDVVRGRVGNLAHREGSAVVTTRFGDVGGIRISAGGAQSNQFDDESDLAFEQGLAPLEDEPDKRSLSVDSLWQLAPDVQFRLEATVSNTQTLGVSPGGPQLRFENDTHSIKGSLIADTNAGLIELKGYHNDVEIDFFDSFQGSNRVTEDLTVLRLQDLLSLGPNTLRGAVEFRDVGGAANANDVSLPDVTQSQTIDNGTIGYRIYSADMMWNRPVTDWLEVTASGRVDHVRFDRDGNVLPGIQSNDAAFDGKARTEYSYNIAGLFKPTAKDRIRLITSRGTSIPSLLELGSSPVLIPPPPQSPAGTPDIVLEGTPDAPTTETLHFELGYERKIAAISGRARASTFYQINNDLREFSQTITDGRSLTNISNGDSTMFGIELEGEGKFDVTALNGQASWHIDYSVFAIDDDLDQHLEDGANVAPDRQTPTHMVNARLGFTRGALELNGFFEYVSEFESNRQSLTQNVIQTIDDYIVVGGRVGYTIDDRVELAVSADQITNAGLERGPGREIDRRIFGTVAVTF